MANPTGDDFLSDAFYHLAEVKRELVMVVAAVERNEAAYTAENFQTASAALNTARDSVQSAMDAGRWGTNP